MSKFLKLSITAMAALSMWACVDNTNSNKPANTNTNASNSNANATASKAAPTVDALMAQEKAANEAYSKGDGQFFEGIMSDKFEMNNMGTVSHKADAVKMISGVKCDVKSMNLSEGKLAKIDDDNYAVIYKTDWDGTCKDNGKDMKIPTPMRAASVWTRSGDKWQAVWHGETMIVDPKNPPKMNQPAPPAKSEKPAANSNANSSANSNSNSSAAPAADPVVEAITANEKAGWEAWKARDANKLGSMLASNASFVNLFGAYSATKDDVVKGWTEGKCDIKSTNVSDVHGESISPTFAFIMFKGTAEGECDGMKLEPVWGTTFSVKEGDTWKFAFGFESPAM